MYFSIFVSVDADKKYAEGISIKYILSEIHKLKNDVKDIWIICGLRE